MKIRFLRFGKDYRVYQHTSKVVRIGTIVFEGGKYRYKPEKSIVQGKAALEAINEKLRELNNGH